MSALKKVRLLPRIFQVVESASDFAIGGIAIMCIAILAGCASVNSVGPAAYVDTPEVSSSREGETSFQGRIQQAQYFHLVDDASSRPLKVTNPPTLDPSYLPYGGMNIALGKNLELGLVGYPLAIFSGISFTLQPSLKWQFLGETGGRPEILGHRAAVFVHGSYTRIANSGNQDGLFGRGGYPWSAESDFKGLSGGISYGFRSSRAMLYYAGVAYQVYDVSAKIHQDVSKTGDYPAADAEFPKTTGISSSASLGLNFGVYSQLSLAYSYTQMAWASFSEQFHGINLGVQISGFKKEIAPLQPVNSTP